MNFTLQGTPYVYQGEEIGMTNAEFATIDDYRDVDALNMYRLAMAEPQADEAQILTQLQLKGRDNVVDADAVGCKPQCRFHDRNAVDQGDSQLYADQCHG